MYQLFCNAYQIHTHIQYYGINSLDDYRYIVALYSGPVLDFLTIDNQDNILILCKIENTSYWGRNDKKIREKMDIIEAWPLNMSEWYLNGNIAVLKYHDVHVSRVKLRMKHIKLYFICDIDSSEYLEDHWILNNVIDMNDANNNDNSKCERHHSLS